MVERSKLIDAMKLRPMLWDQTNVHGKKCPRELEWLQLALELECSVPVIKNLWKLLRDSFSRELRHSQITGKSKWAYFNQMSFLTDVVVREQAKRANYRALRAAQFSFIENDSENHTQDANDIISENSIPKYQQTEALENLDYISEETTTNLNVKAEVEMYDANSSSSRAELKETLPAATTETEPEAANSIVEEFMVKCKKRKLSQRERIDEFLISMEDIEKRKVAILEKESAQVNSPDYNFLISLLPTLEHMPKQKKMLAKMEIMKVLYKIAYEKDSASVSNIIIQSSGSDFKEEENSKFN